MKWAWLMALHGIERGTQTADTVYLGAMATDPWTAISVLGDGVTTWSLLATDGVSKAIVGDGVKLAASTDSGSSWAALSDAGNTISGLYGLSNGSLWGLCNNGDLLRFNSDLSGYSTITPGGVTVNCATYRGIASGGASRIIAVADGMNQAVSTDGGATFGAWSSSSITISPQALHYDGSRFVAAGATGNTANSTTGASWAGLTVTTPPAAPSGSDPSIIGSIELPDRVMLLAESIDSGNYRHAVYFTTATDLEWYANTFNPVSQPSDDLNNIYFKEHSYDGDTPGTTSQQKNVKDEMAATDGAVNWQNAVYTPELGALWWGYYGMFYQSHFGRWSGASTGGPEYQIVSPWFRKTPLAIEALAVVKRSVMPRMAAVDFGEYANRLSYSY